MKRHNLFFRLLVILHLLVSLDAWAKPSPDMPLPARNNTEKYRIQQCQWTGFQASGCDSLLADLCGKIEQKNSLCLEKQVKNCHGENEKEKINSPECWSVERAYCQWTDYEQDPAVCDAHHDEYCKTIDYRTRRCLLLRQRMTIEKNEQQLARNMSVKVLGHRSADFLWKNLGETIKQIDKSIDDLEEQKNNPLSLLVKAQLQKQINELRKQREELVPVFEDARDLRAQCEQIFPIKFHHVEVRYNPNCDTKKDSLCPHKRPGQ